MPFTLTLPKLSPTMEEGTIVHWLKKEGDFVESGDLLLEIATDKATVEYTALDSGFLRKIIVPINGTALINQPIAIFSEKIDDPIDAYMPKEPKVEKQVVKEESIALERQSIEESAKPTYRKVSFQPEPALENYHFKYSSKQNGDTLKASPLAKKIAKEKGLDIQSVKGTGPGGRIVSEDLKGATLASEFTFQREEPTEIPGSYDEEPLSPIRKVIAERLQDAKSSIPHFYVTSKVDAKALTELREQLMAHGVKVSVNDCVIRAVALALRKHPKINSGFNSLTNTIIRFKTIDISVAVTLKDGLITPIIRHADYKKITEISSEIRLLAAKAKEGKLTSEEYKGGSFTISNLGMFHVSEFQAIINPPQAAILAVGGIQDLPVVKEDKIVPGKIMNITLSVDHRVIDGVEAAEFLNSVKIYLETPASLLL